MEDHDGSGGDKTGDKTTDKLRGDKSKKRTRGPTNLKKDDDKGPFPLQWDKAGFPTGTYATKYANHCGKKVRCQVNINLNDWDKDVEVSIKELIWEDLSAKFLIDETHKKAVLKSCGEKWRDFKGKLTKNYIRNKHPKYDSPADCYSFIEPADWEKFKTYRESDEFQETSQKASESAKHNEHPHLMGRRGYNQRIPEWIASSSNSDDVIDRTWYWIHGRIKPSNGEIPNEKTQQVQEEMVEWRKKVKSGEFVPDRHDDVLSRSLNKKEHCGRVRGFPSGVSIKDVFGTSQRTSPRVVGFSDQQVAEIIERVRNDTIQSLSSVMRQEARQEAMSMLKLMGLKVPENMDELQGSCHSANPEKSIGISTERQQNPNPTEIKEPTKCRLTCIHNGEPFNVAIGTIYPSEDSNPPLVHGTPLLTGNARVSVDKILEGTAPLPFPTRFLERVADAIGSFVQWPKELIILGEESHTGGNLSVTSKGKQVSKSSGIKSPMKPNFDEHISSMSSECQKLQDYLALMQPETKVFEVVLPSNIFHLKEDKSLSLTEEDIMQLFRMDFLNMSCIQVWMLFLQKLCEEQSHEDDGRSRVGFLCPTIMSRLGTDKEVNDEVMNYVECSLLKMGGVRIIFAPFCQGGHWFLAVICPLIHEGYFCDPKATSKRDVSFKHYIQIGFRTFRARAGSTLKSGLSMKWSNIVCHQQTGSNECGYYVMRYMLDIVRRYENIKDHKKWFGSKESYTIEEINEVRDLWATYFMDNIL